MQYRYLVVDQNYLRTHELKKIVLESEDVRFVIPNVAMVEMTKSDNRETTAKESLRALTLRPERVFMSRALGECIEWELGSGNSVKDKVIANEGTKSLRKLLRSVCADVATDA